MKKSIELPLTVGFDNNTVIGWMQLNAEAEQLVNEAVLVQCVFAPAYLQQEDGTIKLVEFSLIPAKNAVNLINQGVEDAKAAE